MNEFEKFKGFLNELFPWVKKNIDGDTSQEHYDRIVDESKALFEKYQGEEVYQMMVHKAADVICAGLRS